MIAPMPPDMATRLLLDVATAFGVRAEVRALLAERPHSTPELGPMLLERRKSLGLSHVAMNLRCGLSTSQLKMYERGEQTSPGLRTVHALAHAYELDFGLVLAAALRTAAGPMPVCRKRTRPSASQ